MSPLGRATYAPAGGVGRYRGIRVSSQSRSASPRNHDSISTWKSSSRPSRRIRRAGPLQVAPVPQSEPHHDERRDLETAAMMHEPRSKPNNTPVAGAFFSNRKARDEARVSACSIPRTPAGTVPVTHATPPRPRTLATVTARSCHHRRHPSWYRVLEPSIIAPAPSSIPQSFRCIAPAACEPKSSPKTCKPPMFGM